MTKDQMIELMEKINRGRKDTVEIRRNALNTLVGAFPVRGKVFATVALDELHIYDSYQRSLQGHVKNIARDWNPTKCNRLFHADMKRWNVFYTSTRKSEVAYIK